MSILTHIEMAIYIYIYISSYAFIYLDKKYMFMPCDIKHVYGKYYWRVYHFVILIRFFKTYTAAQMSRLVTSYGVIPFCLT